MLPRQILLLSLGSQKVSPPPPSSTPEHSSSTLALFSCSTRARNHLALPNDTIGILGTRMAATAAAAVAACACLPPLP